MYAINLKKTEQNESTFRNSIRLSRSTLSRSILAGLTAEELVAGRGSVFCGSLVLK
jgi:hypothetical protein